MAIIIYPTEKEQSAPWLIDKEKLDQLDDIIQKHYSMLREARDLQLKAAVEKEFRNIKPELRNPKVKAELFRRTKRSYEFEGEALKVTILLSKGRKVEAETIQEASKMPILADEVPIGLEIVLEVARTRIEIALGKYTRDMLRYLVTSKDENFSRDVAYSLESWIKSIRPPLWQRIWKSIQGIQVLFIFIPLIFTIITFPNPAKQYRNHLSTEISKIIQDGVDSTTINRAVELMLIITADYSPSKYKASISSWLAKLAILGGCLVVFTLIFSFPPKSHISIGKGETRVRFWKVYTRILSVTIPVGIILQVVLNQIHIF
jgi:hypothetical protein